MSIFHRPSAANARILVVLWFTPVVFGQESVYPTPQPSPARIEDQILLLNESVVKQQWPHTLDPVNAPRNTLLLTPGQCVRIGVVATGDNRDEYLRRTNLSFQVRFGGRTAPYEAAPI